MENVLAMRRAIGYSYQWMLAGVAIPGATAATYTATIGGSYTVQISNITGCYDISPAVSVGILPSPSTTVSASGPITFCQGGNVTMTAEAGTGYTYQWKRGGADIAGATLSNYNASATGYYTVIVTTAT